MHLTALTSLDFGRESTVTDETLKLVRGAVSATEHSRERAGVLREFSTTEHALYWKTALPSIKPLLCYVPGARPNGACLLTRGGRSQHSDLLEEHPMVCVLGIFRGTSCTLETAVQCPSLPHILCMAGGAALP